jgi:hypothetical protein
MKIIAIANQKGGVKKQEFNQDMIRQVRTTKEGD